MKTNPTFEKALTLLAHPFSLTALGLLLLNDHLLRRLWPSWWTGKIGDFAWLLFAPFALAALLAWVIPKGWFKRPRTQESWVFSAAFALTAAVFISIKANSLIHLLAMRSIAAVFPTPLTTMHDPSDLLALPALVLGIWLWRRLSAPAPARAARGWVALPLAALLTLANAGMPDPGITCFGSQEGQIIASAGYHSYFSQDGGLTWQYYRPAHNVTCPLFPAEGQWREITGPQEDVLYRYKVSEEILFTTDGGQTWESAPVTLAATEAEQLFYVKSRPGNAVYQPGPLDSFADPESGNMLFAMGHRGVLVHTEDGAWTWRMDAQYQRAEPFPTANAFTVLLGGMIFMAAALSLLIFSTLAIRWTRNLIRITILALAWIAWLLVAVLFPPATTTLYAESMTMLGMLGVFILVVPLAIEQLVRVSRRALRALPKISLAALLGGLLYFLPYVFWLYGILPNFFWASGFALILAAAAVSAGFYLIPSAETI
jgi:hypothetical protein